MIDLLNRLMPYVRPIYRYLQAVRPLCTSVKAFRPLRLKFDSFPQAKIRNIENCQRHDFKLNKQQKSEINCYDNKGATYNGSVHVTKDGTKCVTWKSFYSLRYAPYSKSLIQNFCRNPQGIGDRPWCYTDKDSREWNYCTIPKCSSRIDSTKKQYSGNKVDILWYIILGIVLAMFCFCFVILKRRYVLRLCRTRNTSSNTNDIEPAYTTSLDQQGIAEITEIYQ